MEWHPAYAGLEVDSDLDKSLTVAQHAAFDHEELVVRRGRRTGVAMAAAVHSSVPGPALGPARIWGYESVDSALSDVLALSTEATMQALAAGLERGGGAAVVALSGLEAFGAWERTALLHDLGELVESFDGRLTIRRDVGVSEDDVVTLCGPTAHVAGRSRWAGGNGDPAPMTALGVEATLRAAVEHRLGPVGLAKLHLTVIGLGGVGRALAARLVQDGARVTVSDLDPFEQEYAEQIGAEWADADRVALIECDALLPCAPGLQFGEREVDRLATAIICGAAGDVIARPELVARLAERDVLLVPPALSAAGATILCDAEMRGIGRNEAMRATAALTDRAAALFADAASQGVIPSELLAERTVRRAGDAGLRREPVTPLPAL